MKKANTVIFDMDGVIFDTERIYLETWTSIFDKYGYKMSKEVYTSVMGVGRKNVIKTFKEKYGEDLPIEKMYKEKDEKLLKKIEAGNIPVKRGTYELLDYLKNNNYKIALATSAKRERVEKHLDDANIKAMFNAIVCGDEVERAKPNPDIFLKAAKKLSVEKNKCIVIEDSPSGVKAGYKAGMKVVNIPDLKECDSDMKKYSHKVFNNLIEFKDYLSSKDKVLNIY